jgi:hypothetical protein
VNLNRNKRAFLSVLAVCFTVCGFLVLAGCSGDSDDDLVTPPSANSYAGIWTVVFAGAYTGGGLVTIDAEGSCSASVLLSDGVTSFTNIIAFDVPDSGQMQNGEVLYLGTQIGTLSGQFDSNLGSGSYQTLEPSSGTWSATKN